MVAERSQANRVISSSAAALFYACSTFAEIKLKGPTFLIFVNNSNLNFLFTFDVFLLATVVRPLLKHDRWEFDSLGIVNRF